MCERIFCFNTSVCAEQPLCRRPALGSGSCLIDGDRRRTGRGGRGAGVGRGWRGGGGGGFCLMSERQKSFACRVEAMFTFTGTARGEGGGGSGSRTLPPLTHIRKHMRRRAHYADRRRRRIDCLSDVWHVQLRIIIFIGRLPVKCFLGKFQGFASNILFVFMQTAFIWVIYIFCMMSF